MCIIRRTASEFQGQLLKRARDDQLCSEYRTPVNSLLLMLSKTERTTGSASVVLLCKCKKIHCEFQMNGTRCMEQLHIWYSPIGFLESPFSAESYFTGIKPKKAIKYEKSL